MYKYMRNKYLYISSLDATNGSGIDVDHADFEVALPEQLILQPYSQVRACSVRINPSDNMTEIDDDNDTFYIGIDHWDKRESCIPLLPIYMEHGMYNLLDGTDADLSLDAMIDKELTAQLKEYCLLRGGSKVEISSDRKLKLKMSTMELYGCPTIALTDPVAEYWANPGLVDLEKDGPWKCIVSTQKTQLDQFNMYYGLAVNKTLAEYQYYLSPPIVTGLTGTDENAKHRSHMIEIDLTPAELSAALNPNDYIRFYFGNCNLDNFGRKWGDQPKSNANNNTSISSQMHYYVEINNQFLVVRYKEVENQKVVTKSARYSATQPLWNSESKVRLTCDQWEDAYYSYISLKVESQLDGAGDWNELTGTGGVPLSFSIKKNIYLQKENTTDDANRIAMEFNTKVILDGRIKYSAAVDDYNDKLGFNPLLSGGGKFGGRSSKDANVNRIMTVFSDNDGGGDYVGKSARKAFQILQQDNNMWKDNDHNYGSYSLPHNPNADILSWDSNTDQGLIGTATSNTYLVAEGAVDTNNRDFPMFYLNVPSLPLENVSANFLQGFENQFICPIELSLSQTSQRLYTSKAYTEQYSTMSNSAPLNLSTLKIRICDIKGAPVKQMDAYTIICLEIRENPHLRQEAMMQRLLNSTRELERDNKPVNDQ